MASLVRSPVFEGLAPAIVWQHFSTFCAIPRPSKGEAALREYLKAWAEARGLETSVDATGNLVVRKAANLNFFVHRKQRAFYKVVKLFQRL